MRLSTSVWLPLPRDRVFAFFSDAVNLQALTPEWLRFQILTPMPVSMGQGTQIDYKIRIRGVPVTWRSAITVWQPPERFVDEQLRGPYRTWHHLHAFETSNGGTLVKDDVTFTVPFGFLVGWYVARDLKKIFTYRHHALAKALGVTLPSPPPGVTISRR